MNPITRAYADARVQRIYGGTNARWLKVPPADRRRIDETERAARQHLAKIDAKQKVRSDASQAAAKHHHAMVARGVTFNRMTQY